MTQLANSRLLHQRLLVRNSTLVVKDFEIRQLQFRKEKNKEKETGIKKRSACVEFIVYSVSVQALKLQLRAFKTHQEPKCN